MKKIANHVRAEWYKYLLEILVIVIGIYGAFALENWNQSNVEIKKRNAVIKTLTTEFQSNLKLLEITLDAHQKTIGASKKWLSLSIKNEVISQQKGDSLISGIYQTWTYDPSNGALRTAISSGDIHLLKDDSLLQYLFSWEDLVKDAVEDERYATNQVMKNLDHYNPNISWSNGLHEHFIEGTPQSNHEALLADRAFHQFVSIHLTINQGALGELKDVKEVNQKIIALLQNLEK